MKKTKTQLIKSIKQNLYESDVMMLTMDNNSGNSFHKLNEAPSSTDPMQDVSKEERGIINFLTNFATNAKRLIIAIESGLSVKDDGDKGVFIIAFMVLARNAAPVKKTSPPPAEPPRRPALPSSNANSGSLTASGNANSGSLTASVNYNDKKGVLLKEANQVHRNEMKYYVCIFPRIDLSASNSMLTKKTNMSVSIPSDYLITLKSIKTRLNNILLTYKNKVFGSTASDVKFEIDASFSRYKVLGGDVSINNAICAFHHAEIANEVTVFDKNKTDMGKAADAIKGNVTTKDENKEDFAIEISYFGIQSLSNMEGLFKGIFRNNFLSSLIESPKIEIANKEMNNIEEEEKEENKFVIKFPTIVHFKEDLYLPRYGKKTIKPTEASISNTFNDLYFLYYIQKLKESVLSKDNKKLTDLFYEILVTGIDKQVSGITYIIVDENKEKASSQSFTTKQDAQKELNNLIRTQQSNLNPNTINYSACTIETNKETLYKVNNEGVLTIPINQFISDKLNIETVKKEIDMLNNQFSHDNFTVAWGKEMPKCIVLELADKRSLPLAILNKLKRYGAGWIKDLLSAASEEGKRYASKVL